MHSCIKEIHVTIEGVHYHLFPPEGKYKEIRGEYSYQMITFIESLKPQIVTIYLMNRTQALIALDRRLKNSVYVFHSNSGRTSGEFIDFLNTKKPTLERIICHNRQIKYMLSRNTRNRYPISVIPCGVDINYFKAIRGIPKDIDCIWVGVNRTYGQKTGTDKNLIALIEIAKNCDTKFTLVGDGGGMQFLMSQIDKYSLNDRFYLLPWQEQTQLVDSLRRSKVFVLPSLNEASPRAVSEAMSCELPIIGFDCCIGTTSQIIHWQNGFRVLDHKEFGEKLHLLLNHDDLRFEFGRKSRDICKKHFDERKQIVKTCKLFEELSNTHY